MTSETGCRCERFVESERQLFIEKREDHYFLCDRVNGASVLYGPEISHCPFCGKHLGTAKTARAATLR